MYPKFEMPDSNKPTVGNEMIYIYICIYCFILYVYIIIYIYIYMYTPPNMAADAAVPYIQYLLVG